MNNCKCYKDAFFDDVLFYNIKNFFIKQYPNNTNSYIVFIINFIHLLVGIYLYTGWLLPSRYLPYHTFIVLLIIISWCISKDCLLTKFTHFFSDKKDRYLNISSKTQFILLFLSFFLSLLGSLQPQLSIFNGFYNLFTKYKKYND